MNNKVMNGLIVFNSANDVVFQQFNLVLESKLREIAIEQGLLPKQSNAALDGNIILQIFSPLINSQRIMRYQFDNSYSSFQCEKDLNFAFGELLGFTFIKIGQQLLDHLKRHLGVAIALCRRMYGANLFATQASTVQEELFSRCLEFYEEYLWKEDQLMLIEALPKVLINFELKSMVQETLNSALNHLIDLGYHRCHALLFVSNKFVDISSSKQALPICPSDLLFLALLTRSLVEKGKYLNCSVAVFLQGISQDTNCGCVPCIAHLSQLEKGTIFIQIIEYANLQVASSMFETFFVLQKIMVVQMQGDIDALKSAYENFESFVKQTLESLKKAKLRGDEIESSVKKFSLKWENLRKMYIEYFKSNDSELLVRIESNIPVFMEELKLLFTLTCCDSSSIGLDQLPETGSIVESKLLEFFEFLAVKADRNISIEAYLEDFPGLVHFIYVNRTTGLMIAPDLPANSILPKKQLWNMVRLTRNYLKRGISTVMWKDKSFHYSYFLWFEDKSNGNHKSVNIQNHFLEPGPSGCTFKPKYEPGLLASNYYQQLKEVCFSSTSLNKIVCYELFCIHLGLVTAKCAIEHSRRLVATITDIVGKDFF